MPLMLFLIPKHKKKNSLTNYGDANILNIEDEISGKESFGKLVSAFRQVFLFFPGAFLLLFASMGLSWKFVGSIYFGSPEFPSFPSAFYLQQIVFLILAASLVIGGIGDLLKFKHLVLPASIISVGFTLGCLSGLSQTLADFIVYNGYSFFFLPLALIVPFIAKNWIDGVKEN